MLKLCVACFFLGFSDLKSEAHTLIDPPNSLDFETEAEPHANKENSQHLSEVRQGMEDEEQPREESPEEAAAQGEEWEEEEVEEDDDEEEEENEGLAVALFLLLTLDNKNDSLTV